MYSAIKRAKSPELIHDSRVDLRVAQDNSANSAIDSNPAARSVVRKNDLELQPITASLPITTRSSSPLGETPMACLESPGARRDSSLPSSALEDLTVTPAAKESPGCHPERARVRSNTTAEDAPRFSIDDAPSEAAVPPRRRTSASRPRRASLSSSHSLSVSSSRTCSFEASSSGRLFPSRRHFTTRTERKRAVDARRTTGICNLRRRAAGQEQSRRQSRVARLLRHRESRARKSPPSSYERFVVTGESSRLLSDDATNAIAIDSFTRREDRDKKAAL